MDSNVDFQSVPSVQLTRDLLDLLERKHDIETEMAQTVQTLRRAYSSFFRDLDIVLEEALSTNEA
jgi:hypothetical protein